MLNIPQNLLGNLFSLEELVPVHPDADPDRRSGRITPQHNPDIIPFDKAGNPLFIQGPFEHLGVEAGWDIY